jgi:hypothetical protein
MSLLLVVEMVEVEEQVKVVTLLVAQAGKEMLGLLAWT